MASDRQSKAGPHTDREKAPDERVLTKSQMTRLAAATGVSARELEGRTVAQLRKDLAWSIDLTSLLFRRVCGRVVRTNPATGLDEGVPAATVHVEDTDANFIGYFPGGSPYGWLHGFGVRREEIASVRTDACGNFCVWIPRFDIDWVVRWRIERECYGEVLRKPTLADYLERLRDVIEIPERAWPVPPRPGPDPAPDFRTIAEAGVDGLRTFEALLGKATTSTLDLTPSSSRMLGERVMPAVDQPLFDRSAPAPALPELTDKVNARVAALRADAGDPLDDQADGAPARVTSLKWLPVLQCRYVIHPTVVPILDVPDITFRVTQDVDGDGDEETIYSEGFFDVRWDAGVIPPVTLRAASFARSAPGCGGRPELGPCAEPEIVLVGDMPLKNPTAPGTFPFVDTTTGYAVRPNRAHPSGRPDEVAAPGSAATAPLAGVLELWGCNQHTLAGQPANRYRILSSLFSPVTSTFGSPAPIIDHWNNWRVVGSPSVLEWKSMTADGDGWYEVLNPADGWMPGEQFLLEWHAPANGLHELTLELGHHDAATLTTTVIGAGAPVRMRIDNSGAEPRINSLAWRVVGAPSFTPLPLNCPTINRSGQDIEIAVGYQGWADHLRSISIGASGCGLGNPTLKSGFESMQSGVPAGTETAGYWHKSGADNNVSVTAVYDVPASLPPGAYSVGITVFSRAFNPDDGHVYEPLQPDTGFNPGGIYSSTTQGIAIVD